MCEFCAKHTRKKWFLDPENYMDHMLEDKKRLNVLQKLAGYSHEYHLRDVTEALYITKHPLLGRLAKYWINKIAKYDYAGQVVTLQDALEIVDLADNHVLFECACRKLIGGKKELYCLNFGPMRDICKTTNPKEKMVEIDTYEAKTLLKELDEKGCFHEVYFAKAPFPVTLCNCERKYCIALKHRFAYDLKSALLKSHEVAVADQNKCKCGEYHCMKRCQFEAMYVDTHNDKIVIDPSKCFGCGLCESVCPNNAISLVDRDKVAGAKGKW